MSAFRMVRDVARYIVQSGTAWISTVKIAGRPALRACITNWRTERRHIDRLALPWRKPEPSARDALGHASQFSALQDTAVILSGEFLLER